MNIRKSIYLLIVSLYLMGLVTACKEESKYRAELFESSAAGNQMAPVELSAKMEDNITIELNPNERYQTITGIGGSFTEASAYLLNRLSVENREKILEAYFGDNGARYSLTRTHMNSCDFSLGNYSYAPVEEDIQLDHFSIEEDMDDIIPMIKDATKLSTEGFKIIASPWTAPPWMKDNNDWRGGKLLQEYYPVWARFFSKYIKAYAAVGIPIWAVTVENEPLGNDNNWESMHYTPEEMNDFVKNHLGPRLSEDQLSVKIFGYDQNRDEELYKWTDAMYDDKEAAKYFDGTAVHWYASTYDYFPEALQYAHNKAPGKHLIQTEGCVDAEVPVWKNDLWYWSKEATDWGWEWAPEDLKYLHPKYVPVYRYARDIIGCFNNHVDGWVDWNMVLDRQGGPNWFKNWCVAPVIVDPEADEVYFTPLYYVMKHFSKYIRPEAKRIGISIDDETLQGTAVQNPDGSFTVVLLNEGETPQNIQLNIEGFSVNFTIDGQALQTLILNKQ